MQSINLKHICTSKASINEDGNDYFVGVKIEGDKTQVNFPLGYRISNQEKDIRKDIQLLLRTLELHTNKTNLISIQGSDSENNNLPLRSYFYIIQDFLTHDYIREYQQTDVISDKGKINWNKTIKKCKPQFIDDDAYYMDFVINRSYIINGEFTKIHSFFVHHCFKTFGWLFTSFVPQTATLKFNRDYFSQVLYRELRQTYDDRKITLINHMILILDNFIDEESNFTYIYGTNRFEYVWEDLIDSVFGVKDKDKFFPKTSWNLIGETKKDNRPLEPDTILVDQGYCIVIDAKYYKYGVTKKKMDLPNSSDISKQLTYEDYLYRLRDIEKKYIKKDDIIENIFLLPTNKTEWTNESFHIFGTASSNYSMRDKTASVKGLFIDTKDLMSKSKGLYNDLIKNIKKL